MIDVEKLLATLKNITLQNRPSLLELEDGSARVAIYNDAKQTYELIAERFVSRSAMVSTLESLEASIQDQARRFSNPTGAGMRVALTSWGATFDPDMTDGRHQITYRRVPSYPLERIKNALGKAHSHKTFLALLSSLSPWIVDYVRVLPAFRSVALTKNSRLSSQPTLVEGKRGGGFEFEISIDGAAERLPAAIALRMPYVRAGAKLYELPVEIDINDDGNGNLVFTPTAPTIAVLDDQAMTDELEQLTAFRAAEKLADMLLVVDFT